MTSRATSDVPLDVGRLRLLREVGLRGSIAGAARAVGLTPSAVSQQLALLERETGAALVDRSPRGVVLTGAGHALSVRAGEVLDLLGTARADLERLAGSVGGPVAVASVASAAATVVSAAGTDLRTRRPGIEVTVTSAEPERGLGLLLAGDVDLAIVDEYDYVPLALPEHALVRELCTEPLVVVRPRGARPRTDRLDRRTGRRRLGHAAGGRRLRPRRPGRLPHGRLRAACAVGDRRHAAARPGPWPTGTGWRCCRDSRSPTTRPRCRCSRCASPPSPAACWPWPGPAWPIGRSSPRSSPPANGPPNRRRKSLEPVHSGHDAELLGVSRLE